MNFYSFVVVVVLVVVVVVFCFLGRCGNGGRPGCSSEAPHQYIAVLLIFKKRFIRYGIMYGLYINCLTTK